VLGERAVAAGNDWGVLMVRFELKGKLRPSADRRESPTLKKNGAGVVRTFLHLEQSPT